MNSSVICRSLPAQNGQEPCIERTARFGAMPTPMVRAGATSVLEIAEHQRLLGGPEATTP